MMNPGMSSLTPADIGRVLAMSLDTSVTFEKISDAERSLLRDASVTVERYYVELLLLSAFAIDYAIFKLLGTTKAGKQVRDGYVEVFRKAAERDKPKAMFLAGFHKRCSEYAKVAEASEPGDINPIGLAFGGFLASDNGHAQLLALTHAPNYFFSHVEATAAILKQAGLLKDDAA